MKRILSILLLSVLFFSCKKDIAFTSQAVQSDLVTPGQQNVKLYKCWSVDEFSGYGPSTIVKTFYVEVANLAYQKNVYIHHLMVDGTWQDLPLTYINSIDANTDMWELNYSYISTAPTSQALGNQFAIKYVVNGQTYWDNNGGNNYQISGTVGMYLQNGINVSVDTNYSYYAAYTPPSNSNFYISVDLRNIAYAKNVSVVYSTDGWKTVQTAPLSFPNYLIIGEETSLPNPNPFGIERWTGSITVTPSTQQFIQFAVSYTVNGQTYWDNNFGKNYQLQVHQY